MFLALHGHPRFVLSFVFVAQVLLQLQFVTCINCIKYINYLAISKCKFMHILIIYMNILTALVVVAPDASMLA